MKIQQLKKGTLFTYIPTTIQKELNLKKGDNMTFETNKDQITITITK